MLLQIIKIELNLVHELLFVCFLGYPSGFKGYKRLDLESHSVLISRNVVFKEKVFPFKTSDLLSTSVDMFPNTILPMPTPLHFVETMPVRFDEDSSLPSVDLTRSHPQNKVEPVSTVQEDSGTDLSGVSRLKRTTRAPTYLSQYHCSFVPAILPTSVRLPRSSDHLTSHHRFLIRPRYFPSNSFPASFKTLYPISSVISYDRLNPVFQSSVITYSMGTEPKTFKQAMTSDKWKGAVNVELVAMEQNGTWKIVVLPEGKNVVGCKWFSPLSTTLMGLLRGTKDA